MRPLYTDVYEDRDITESVGDSELVAKLKNMKKVKSFLRAVLDFILWSSVNSNKISLTLKAGLPFLVLLGISDTQTLEMLVGEIGQFTVNLAGIVTGAITIFAIFRKLWFSMK